MADVAGPGGHRASLGRARAEAEHQADARRDPHPTDGALYLIDISADGGYQTVGAMDVADMMDVLARWAPALHTDVMTNGASPSTPR